MSNDKKLVSMSGAPIFRYTDGEKEWEAPQFTHTGGPIFWLAICMVPGLWFGLYFGKPDTYIFLVALVIIQISYWPLLIFFVL